MFVKFSWGRRRWWPRLSDVRTGQVFQSLAVREWEGLKTFERLRLQVPERLALLEEGVLWKRSALSCGRCLRRLHVRHDFGRQLVPVPAYGSTA